MQLGRAIHFDERDMNVMHHPARTGEWCISSGFEFSNFTQSDLVGETRQAFANGWLGLETFRRVTFAAVTRIEPFERDALALNLADNFVERNGAPDRATALPVAKEELRQMVELCDEHLRGTVLTVARALTEAGVRGSFRMIEPRAAGLEQFAIHSSLNDEPLE
ncbi:MAG: DUF6505 family protein [Pseudomonadota bacterium]